jgi:rhodanese-related sulfurtransferase
MLQHNRFFLNKHSISIFAVLLACLFFVTAASAASTEFPGRTTYPDVNIIELDALKKVLDSVVVVDVRSAYEYRTLRIKGATNIPVADNAFVDNIYRLRASTDKAIIFYCNGKTCMKSYKAAQKCALANIKDVRAYDAGIMDWAKAYPKDSQLLGKVLSNPKLLISKAQFKKHLLSPDQFANKVSSGKNIVLDVRDSFQRDALAVFPGRERRAYLDQTKKLDRYIRRAKKQGRTLLIYDAAGKQVRWLQYYLEYKRVPNYFFMKGGARAYYSSMTDEFLKR